MDDLKLPHYPIVTFLVRWGRMLAVLAGIAPVAITLWLALSGSSPLWLLAGALGGAALWLLLLSYVEVLCLLADALMPR